MLLADVVVSVPAQHPGHAWMHEHLPGALRYRLSSEDLARIDAFRGEPLDLHELLPALLPRDCASWYETRLVAQRGTEMFLGYFAVPRTDAIDIGFVSYAPAHGRMIGPLGPARVTASEMVPPEGCSSEAWRELRAAAGIVLRAMMLGCGEAV